MKRSCTNYAHFTHITVVDKYVAETVINTKREKRTSKYKKYKCMNHAQCQFIGDKTQWPKGKRDISCPKKRWN